MRVEAMTSYPTEAELETIRNWYGSPKGLWEYVESIWSYPEYMLVHRDETEPRVLKLVMHTGGWSGNEEIIDAMRESVCLFFGFYHTKWERGGYYYFEVPEHLWDVNVLGIDKGETQ